MLYYVCDSDKSMDVPWGVDAKFYTTEAQAITAVNQRASSNPGRSSYVHAFPESFVTFKATSSVVLESEYL